MLVRVARGGCPLPGGVRGQVGGCLGVPAHGRVGEEL